MCLEFNNDKNGYDDDVYRTSLGKAIRSVSHPCESFTQKINTVTEKYYNAVSMLLADKKAAWKTFFKDYYENERLYNYHGLFIIEPF